jgi:selenocysteine-specific elongation factor
MPSSSHDAILGTAGHIDHGKTALVRALTGVDTDRLEEERRRGISIDLGFAHLDLDGVRVGIVDVPGHERFIRNMLAGAAGIDVALLVVAADDSVMPQTREHLEVLRLLEVERGLVAITKADLVDPDWLDLVEQEVRELVAGSFLDGAPLLRTSATDGRGLDELRAALRGLCAGLAAAPPGELFRLAVDRSFALPGLGTVVTGSVAAGTLAAGDEVEWLPAGRRLRVRGLQSHGAPLESVARGQRAAVHLAGAHHTEVLRGHVLAAPDHLVPGRRLTVRLRLLDAAPWPLRHRARVRLHLGTAEVMAAVTLLEGSILEPGRTALAQLFCAEPVAAIARQPFVIRAESPLVTLGGGKVLQPTAPRLRRRDRATIEALPGLLDEDEATRAETAMRLADARPPDARGLCREAGLTLDRAEALMKMMRRAGTLIALSGGRSQRVLHRDTFARVETAVRTALEAMHAAAPLEDRLARRSVLKRLPREDEAAVQEVVDHLIEAGELVGDEGTVALASFSPTLTEAEQAQRAAITEAFREGGFSPPDVDALAARLETDAPRLRPILELCARQGELVHLGGGAFLHRDVEVELKRRIAASMPPSGGLTVSEIRGALGTSRRFAVPLCEYLDRIGYTRRVGDKRVLTTSK